MEMHRTDASNQHKQYNMLQFSSSKLADTIRSITSKAKQVKSTASASVNADRWKAHPPPTTNLISHWLTHRDKRQHLGQQESEDEQHGMAPSSIGHLKIASVFAGDFRRTGPPQLNCYHFHMPPVMPRTMQQSPQFRILAGWRTNSRLSQPAEYGCSSLNQEVYTGQKFFIKSSLDRSTRNA